MKKSMKVALAVYVIVMLVSVSSFFMQKKVTYNDHINPAREKILSSMGTSPEIALSVEYNRYLSEKSIGMGNEIEEHLLSLLVANLATGIFLVFCILNRKTDNIVVQ